MTELSRRDPEARRTAIMDATLALMAERGLANTSIDDIVRAAGVAKGTFYLYFRTRDDLLNAIVLRFLDELLYRVKEIAEDTSIPVVDRLLGLPALAIEMSNVPESLELAQLFHQSGNAAMHAQMVEGTVDYILPIFESLITEGMASGVFAVTDAHLCAWWVLGTLLGFDRAFHDPTDLPNLTSSLRGFILRGLAYTGDV